MPLLRLLASLSGARDGVGGGDSCGAVNVLQKRILKRPWRTDSTKGYTTWAWKKGKNQHLIFSASNVMSTNLTSNTQNMFLFPSPVHCATTFDEFQQHGHE